MNRLNPTLGLSVKCRSVGALYHREVYDAWSMLQLTRHIERFCFVKLNREKDFFFLPPVVGKVTKKNHLATAKSAAS